VIALVVVILHEVSEVSLQLFRGIVVLQFHHILHRTVIALDLALGHRVVGCATSMLNVLALQVVLQIIVAQSETERYNSIYETHYPNPMS